VVYKPLQSAVSRRTCDHVKPFTLNANGWRVFGAESAFFDHFAIFSKANSSYSEFGGVFWGKEEGVSY
jgi:hypothetical protein